MDPTSLTDWCRAEDVAEAIAVCEDPACPCEVRYAARLTPEAERRLLWGLDGIWEPPRA
jgi:hypothetical protein